LRRPPGPMPPYAGAGGDGAFAIPRPDRRASPRLGPSSGARLFYVCFYLAPQYIAARSRRRTACTRPVRLPDLAPLPFCSPLPFCAFSVAFLHSPLMLNPAPGEWFRIKRGQCQIQRGPLRGEGRRPVSRLSGPLRKLQWPNLRNLPPYHGVTSDYGLANLN
jgi:hypothetical protein